MPPLRLYPLLAAGATCLTLAACGGDDDPPPQAAAPAQTESAAPTQTAPTQTPTTTAPDASAPADDGDASAGDAPSAVPGDDKQNAPDQAGGPGDARTRTLLSVAEECLSRHRAADAGSAGASRMPRSAAQLLDGSSPGRARRRLQAPPAAISSAGSTHTRIESPNCLTVVIPSSSLSTASALARGSR